MTGVAGDPAIKPLWAFSGRDCFGKEAQVSDKQLPCLQGVQSWTDKPNSWRNYAIFKIRGHVTNGLETIKDLCPLDGSTGTAAIVLHTHILEGHRSPTCYPEPVSVSTDRVGCLRGRHRVIFQNGVTVGALIRKRGFQRWLPLCVMLRKCFFLQTSNAWKTLHLATGFELEQYNPAPTNQHCSLLGRC